MDFLRIQMLNKQRKLSECVRYQFDFISNYYRIKQSLLFILIILEINLKNFCSAKIKMKNKPITIFFYYNRM
ncbi:hypothetical protein pb186bvf_003792 [Paramecium bursaria]